jgi:hypothetical protein
MKHSCYRVIPCLNKDGGKPFGMVIKIVTKLVTYGNIYLALLITKLYLPKFELFSDSKTGDAMDLFITAALCFRLYKRALMAPLMCSIEMALFFKIVYDLDAGTTSNALLFLPVAIQFLIHRLFVLVNKVNYMIVSWATAFKNKKQRIEN